MINALRWTIVCESVIARSESATYKSVTKKLYMLRVLLLIEVWRFLPWCWRFYKIESFLICNDTQLAHVIRVKCLAARFAIYLLDALAKLKESREISTNISISPISKLSNKKSIFYSDNLYLWHQFMSKNWFIWSRKVYL